MPKVGKRDYGYDEKGKEAAAAESERTGLPVVYKKEKVGRAKRFNEGGVVYLDARGGRAATRGTRYRG